MIERESTRPRENWFDADYVKAWLDQQAGRADERMKSFAMIRALVPRRDDEAFTAVDIGGGDGWLAEVLLERFSAARVTILDQSEVMLDEARGRLARFGSRAQAKQGDLRFPEWTAQLAAPYDVVVSTIAIHNLGDPPRIRTLYKEIGKIVADGGCFLLYDYMRASDPLAQQMARWGAMDPAHGFDERTPQRAARRERDNAGDREHRGTPFEQRGSLEEQIGWLREAGFAPVECFWKQFQAALIGGFRGGVEVPEER